jgi:hypothetical protein
VKKHPMMLKLIDERVAARRKATRAEIAARPSATGVRDAVEKAWNSLEGNALSRRCRG